MLLALSLAGVRSDVIKGPSHLRTGAGTADCNAVCTKCQSNTLEFLKSGEWKPGEKAKEIPSSAKVQQTTTGASEPTQPVKLQQAQLEQAQLEQEFEDTQDSSDSSSNEGQKVDMRAMGYTKRTVSRQLLGSGRRRRCCSVQQWQAAFANDAAYSVNYRAQQESWLKNEGHQKYAEAGNKIRTNEANRKREVPEKVTKAINRATARSAILLKAFPNCRTAIPNSRYKIPGMVPVPHQETYGMLHSIAVQRLPKQMSNAVPAYRPPPVLAAAQPGGRRLLGSGRRRGDRWRERSIKINIIQERNYKAQLSYTDGVFSRNENDGKVKHVEAMRKFNERVVKSNKAVERKAKIPIGTPNPLKINLPGIGFGGKSTAEGCFFGCGEVKACKQAIFNHRNRRCYPMKSISWWKSNSVKSRHYHSVGPHNDGQHLYVPPAGAKQGFSSVHCNSPELWHKKKLWAERKVKTLEMRVKRKGHIESLLAQRKTFANCRIPQANTKFAFKGSAGFVGVFGKELVEMKENVQSNGFVETFAKESGKEEQDESAKGVTYVHDATAEDSHIDGEATEDADELSSEEKVSISNDNVAEEKQTEDKGTADKTDDDTWLEDSTIVDRTSGESFPAVAPAAQPSSSDSADVKDDVLKGPSSTVNIDADKDKERIGTTDTSRRRR
jgi:hypothetical protein